MERRRLGQLEVSAVGVGCGTMTPFYGEPDRAAGIATIRRAREIGVDLLDTADGYGRGRNEELVAEARRLEENAEAAALSLSADTAEVLAGVFAPGAAAGLRYPESHLVRLGI